MTSVGGTLRHGDALPPDVGGGAAPEVAHRLRSEAGLQDTRVVAVTGQAPEDDCGADRYGDLDGVLVKPVDARALREALAANN